jgi:signal transduction histidine kinase
LYTGLVVLAVAGFGVGVYVLLDAELRVTFDQDLLGNVHHAADALQLDIGADGRLQPDTRFLDQLAHTGGIVEVLTADGSVLATSNGASPLALTTADLTAGVEHAHQVRDIGVGGSPMRLVVEPIHAPDGSLVGLVTWARPTDEIESLMHTVALSLLVAGTTICLLAFGGGWLLARRALAPVADLTSTARSVAASGDVGARVPNASPDDELGQLSLAFNEMLATIEANEAGLQQFLADASHELRTPITTVRANLELAARDDVGPTDKALLYAEAKLEADRMARLVADLLSLTRAELEPARPHDRQMLNDIVEESIAEVGHQEGPVVEVQRLEPAAVLGDRDRLKQLCHILLDNARKYAPGGTVAVCLAGGPEARLIVADTGIGIPPSERDRVFGRFYRSDAARGLQPQGSGLGLAIAGRIVASHRGSISVEETPGGGTTVTVRLPGVDRPGA